MEQNHGRGVPYSFVHASKRVGPVRRFNRYGSGAVGTLRLQRQQLCYQRPRRSLDTSARLLYIPCLTPNMLLQTTRAVPSSYVEQCKVHLAQSAPLSKGWLLRQHLAKSYCLARSSHAPFPAVAVLDTSETWHYQLLGCSLLLIGSRSNFFQDTSYQWHASPWAFHVLCTK